MKFVQDQIKTIDVSVLVKVLLSCIVHAHFHNNSARASYIHVCMQANIPRLWSNQVVRVIDDMAEVMKLHVGHGQWCDGMENVRPIV